MMTIVTEFGKFRYNRLPIGMCASADIYKSKVDKLLGNIKGVKTYIDDILVLTKDCFKNHMHQLRIIFGILCAAGFKVNASKCCFGLINIHFLGYVITREGTKTDPKKVQGIVDPGQSATTIEVQALIGMVQYYRDMCPRQLHRLSPLTEAARIPKYRKYFWMTL